MEEKKTKGIEAIVKRISPISHDFGEKIQRRLDSLTKPKGSLGRLEEIVKSIGMIEGSLSPDVTKKVIFTVAGDHGVVEEGVSAYPQEVTYQMVLNFLKGGAGINVLARFAGAEVIVVDMGIKKNLEVKNENLKIKKIRQGTSNMVKGPAMTEDEAVRSIQSGIEVFEETYKKQGISVVGIGEMGIGNTTSASAITALITGREAEEVTSRGTGIDDAVLKRKIDVVKKAIETNHPRPGNPIEILSGVGGFEIGGMAGIILAAASRRVPVFIDGFISTSAALIASLFTPVVKDYLIASHLSVEKGHKVALHFLGKEPLLNLNMRLGEGTGSALAMLIAESGVRILNEMSTFGEANVSEKER